MEVITSVLFRFGVVYCCFIHTSQHRLTFETHDCGHQAHNQDVIHDVHIEETYIVHKRSIDHPLRMHLHFDTSVNRLPTAHRKLIETKVWEAVAFWQDTLKIRETRAPIRLNRKCLTSQVRYFNQTRFCSDGCAVRTLCGGVTVPEEHLHSCDWWDTRTNRFYSPPDTQPGVEGYDYILYVAALSTRNCGDGNTIAYASHCQQESALDRPIAGYISLCPDAVSTNHHSHEELLSTLKHEILHALGFSAGLFAFYRDRNGLPLTPREQFSNKPDYNARLGVYQWSSRVVADILRVNWRIKGQTIFKTFKMVVLPTVVAEVRRHFNCPTLEGAELEDQGINGTALTHWEKRVFENEAMTGTYTQSPSMSRITLALMEDTGWYKANYAKADPFSWGKNLGCDFVKKSCYEWIETRLNRNQDIHPFCIRANRGQPVTECTKSRSAVAICNLSEYTEDLPPQYQYFSDIPGVHSNQVGRFGGSVPLADYCPYLQELVWKRGDEILRGSVCSAEKNNLAPDKNYLLERYSPRSKCFVQPSPWILRYCDKTFIPHYGSGCYEYDCSQDIGLTVHVSGRSYLCEWAGKVLSITEVNSHWLHKGNIICPPCSEMCADQGIVCPPDRKSAVAASTTRQQSFPLVPCRATSMSLGSSYSVVFNFIAANILCFMIVYLCHR